MTSRPPPPRFEGCTLAGVRFEADAAVTCDSPRTVASGVVAVDDATGERLWSVVLWTTVQDIPGLIIPPRYLHRITPDVVPARLRAVDEHGVLYIVDLATRSARCLGRRVDDNRFPRPGTRVAPPSPPPISFEGRRYEQVVDGDRQGLSQRSGLLCVTDEASGLRIDVATVYATLRRDARDGEGDDVFFASATLDAQARAIVIENERGERFAWRIDDGAVQRLP